MQFAPIKPTLKAPGTKRLKLQCDVPHSNFAFEFNLRHYTEVPVVLRLPNGADPIEFRTLEAFEAAAARARDFEVGSCE